MKILIIYRHYWPDTPPLGSILRSLAEGLASRGHRVTVVTAQPSYRGKRQKRLPRRGFVGGVKIVRLPLPPDPGRGPGRALVALLFLAQTFAYAARHRFDLVWATTLPPVINGVVGRAAARFAGARFLYHVLDVYPEAAVAGGLAREGWLARLAARVNSATCRAADAVVVLSDDMVRTIGDRGGNGRVRFHVINNPVLAELEPGDRLVGEEPAEAFRFIFSGNMGRFQSLPLLVEAMAHVPPESGIELVFLGDGPVRGELEKRVARLGLPHVRFLDRTGPEQAFAAARQAQVGVVSLAPGVYRTSYPSKVMTYLAAGLPILAVIEAESALAQYLASHDAGRAAGHDAKDIASAMMALQERYRDGVPRMRLTGLALADFGRAQTTRRWADLVERLGLE